MTASDNRDIRRICQHIGLTDRGLMDKVFEIYKGSDEGKTMSFEAWIKNYLIAPALLTELLRGNITRDTLNEAGHKKPEEWYAQLKQFFYDNIPLYEEFILDGVNEATFFKFTKTLKLWLTR